MFADQQESEDRKLLRATVARLAGELVLARDLAGAIPAVPADQLQQVAGKVAADIAGTNPALGRLLAAQMRTPGLIDRYKAELDDSLPLLRQQSNAK